MSQHTVALVCTVGWIADLAYCGLGLTCCTAGWICQYPDDLACTVGWNVDLVYFGLV